MKRQSNFLLRSLLAVLWTYGVFGGATASGLLTPQYALVTLALIALTVSGWLIVRWHQHWIWCCTPIDGSLILWAIAIILSTLTNLEAWARISIGLWYALAFLGMWFILHDSLSNHILDSKTLIESLLLAGLLVILVGCVQLGFWLVNWLRSPGATFELPRVAATLDNPNFLAAFLVIVIPFAVSRLSITRLRAGQIFLVLYIIVALTIEIITFSRGGWVAAFTALGVLAVLLLAHNNLLTISQLRAWWHRQPYAARAALTGAVILIVIIGTVLAFTAIRSLNTPGRTADLRTYIYDAAIQMFKEKPLTGYGLFTFGRNLMRLASTPPYTPHNSAHNLPLNIAAELGIVGLLALIVTVFSLVRAMYRNWRTSTGSQRILLSGAIAGSIGMGVHHLLDTPTSASPILAIAWIVALALAAAQTNVTPVRIWQRRMLPALLTVMWTLLLITGFWTANIYKAYVASLQYGSQDGDYEGAAQRLQSVVEADPSMPIYHLYHGYFLGLSAERGNVAGLLQAIIAYRRFCDLEPYYAPAWANLGALYWQSGERQQAISAMERAVSLAPLAWMLHFNLGMYYEAVQNVEGAIAAYRTTLSLYPDASLYPEWQQTEFRRKIAGENDKLSPPAQVVVLLSAGKAPEAEPLWHQAPRDIHATVSGHVISEVLALEIGDRKTAESELDAASRATAVPQNDPWVLLGVARLARFDGDSTKSCEQRDLARAVLATSPVAIDDRISSIAYVQFWKVGLPAYFLPQVYSPPADAPLVSLLEDC
jgi:putative inorganic carbon (hco3(-)) transporter